MTQDQRVYEDLLQAKDVFSRALERALGFPAPVPEAVAEVLAQSSEDSLKLLKNWVALLNLAVTPARLRTLLSHGAHRRAAESLLRYYVCRNSTDDADREKVDLVASFLYRQIMASAKPEPHIDCDHPSEFEEEIYAILGLDDVPELPAGHRGLVREFPAIRQEVEEFTHFDELMDSGVLQRVRDIKARFGTSLYHPRVLATLAEYNQAFGRRFDDLFGQATQEIKHFLAALESHEASPLLPIEDGGSVQQVTEMDEHEVLQNEYGSAQQDFRRVSRLRKAVGRRSRIAAKPEPAAAAGKGHRGKPLPPAFGIANSTIEESQLCRIQEQIRTFVLASEQKTSCAVPLRNANAGLNASEMEAFRANFGGEKSFRADCAAALRDSVALQARISMELQEMESRLASAYLWKPHATSLLWLLHRARLVEEACEDVIVIAQQRGLSEKVTALDTCLQRLRTQMQAVAHFLERAQEKTAELQTS
ncbi:MAG: hypothetical protein AB7O65_03240 [Candidatus Korobacteraceae bacterium]